MKYLLLLCSAFLASHASGEPWDGTNNPTNMSSTYQYQFSELPLQGTVDQQHMPWSDNYWETDWGGISFRWNTVSVSERDPDSHQRVNQYQYFQYTPPSEAEVKSMSKEQLAQLSPAEKYDILMKRYDYPTVTSERERTGPGYEDWQGICHGWVPASINHVEPLPTDMDNEDGVIVPFGSSDVKGLLSYYYGVVAYDFARGNRILSRMGNTLQYLDAVDSYGPQTWIKVPNQSYVYDENGGNEINSSSLADRVSCTNLDCFKQNSVSGTVEALNLVAQIGQRPEARGGLFGGTRGVKDPNAGAFHIVMANQLGLLKHPFVGNINKKIKNAQIWNQPVVAYVSQVTSDNNRGRRGRRVGITTRLTYVSEIPQTWEVVVGTPMERFSDMTFSYTLDVDSDGNITGGDWQDASYHPSFAWKHDALEFKGYFSKLKELYKPRF